MKIITLSISLLMLTGCGAISDMISPTRHGATYKVKSGFYAGCKGKAVEKSSFSSRTMLKLYCNGEYDGYEFFNSYELEEVK